MLALGLMAGCGGQGALPDAPAPAGFAFANIGGDLLVSRQAAPLSYSDGLAAKRAALAYCAGQGARLNPAAFGQFSQGGTAGNWRFAGGCI